MPHRNRPQRRPIAARLVADASLASLLRAILPQLATILAEHVRADARASGVLAPVPADRQLSSNGNDAAREANRGAA